MPSRTRSSTISRLLRSTNSRGGMPFLSASYVIGVPCSSVPLAINTREPRSRSKRARTSAGTAKPTTWPMCRGPFAYGHAGAINTVLGTGDHKGKLAARPLTERGQHRRRGAAQHLFVQLRELTRQREGPLGQRFRDQLERLADAKRRLKRDRRTRIFAQRLEKAAHLTRLARQVAEKREARTAVARDRKRSGDRARTWNGDDGVACGPGGGDQRLPRVREGGRAGVAHEREIALLERGHDPRQAPLLYRGAVAQHRLADAVSRQEPRRHPGVFGRDRRDLAEDAHGPGA